MSCLGIKYKNYFKKACLIEKNNYFCTRFENEGEKKNKNYVPRHIELTAVFRRDSKNKQKESKRIERFE